MIFSDGGNLVAMIFLLQGVSVLLCWNTFLTAYDYFALTMQPGEAKPTFEFWFAIYFNMPCFVMNMLMIRYGPKIPITVRIVTCQIGYLAILLGTPFIGRAAQSGDITLKMVNTLIYLMVGTCGLLTGLMFPSMTGLAAAFPGKYMTAAMSGVGFGGIIVGIIRVATKATLPGDDAGIRHASLIYFFVCAATMVLAILTFFVMVRTPFAQYHMDKAGLGRSPRGTRPRGLRSSPARTRCSPRAPWAPRSRTHASSARASRSRPPWRCPFGSPSGCSPGWPPSSRPGPTPSTTRAGSR